MKFVNKCFSFTNWLFLQIIVTTIRFCLFICCSNLTLCIMSRPVRGQVPLVKRHCTGRRTAHVPMISPRCEKNVSSSVDTSVVQENTDKSVERNAPSTSSQYYADKQELMNKWKELRCHMLPAAWDSACPLTFHCVLCQQTSVELIKCQDCGPQYTVCCKCAENDHIFRPFHHLLRWKVCWFTTLFIYYSLLSMYNRTMLYNALFGPICLSTFVNMYR